MKAIQPLTLCLLLFVALASCQKADITSLSDASTHQVVPEWYQKYDQVFDYVWDYGLDVAVVMKDGHYGYVNKTGDEILPPIYDQIPCSIHPYPNGLPQSCMKDSLYGAISDYKIIVDCKYEKVIFDEDVNLYRVLSSEKWGLLDKDGKEIFPCKYNEIGWFSEGLASFQDPETDLWGYLDMKGHEVIKAKYIYADTFIDGVAAVIFPFKKCLIDVKGNGYESDMMNELDSSWNRRYALATNLEQIMRLSGLEKYKDKDKDGDEDGGEYYYEEE